MERININDIKELGEINLIDVRETFEFDEGNIEGAKNIPMMGLIMNAENFLEKEKKYYIMCQAGGRSMQVCNELDAKGYDVVNLDGGYSSYQK